MRRKDREIASFERMLAVVDACDCCRLGLVDEDGAYIVPMNFGWEAGGGTLVLYFHCAAEGKKLRLLRAQTRVSFEMDTAHAFVRREEACGCTMRYQSVMGRGTVRALEQPEERARAMARIVAHYAPELACAVQESALREAVLLRLEVTEWSCKANGVGL